MLLSNPRQRWVLSRTPPINPAFALAECIWILTGRNDLAFLQYFNSKYQDYVGCTDQVYGAYGFRLRHASGLDQLERAFDSLRRNPNSRQVVLQIWNAQSDMPVHNGDPASTDIPCNLLSMLKVRDGALEWTQVLRSNDVFKGLPYNFIQFTTLQEVMAGWLELNIGKYCQITDSLHCYDNDLTNVVAATRQEVPFNTDSLAFSKAESDELFRELASRVDKLRLPSLTTSEFEGAMSWSSAPQPVRNILLVLGAESARRRRWKIENEIMQDCTNQLYRRAFSLWLKSRPGRKSI